MKILLKNSRWSWRGCTARVGTRTRSSFEQRKWCLVWVKSWRYYLRNSRWSWRWCAARVTTRIKTVERIHMKVGGKPLDEREQARTTTKLYTSNTRWNDPRMVLGGMFCVNRGVPIELFLTFQTIPFTNYEHLQLVLWQL